MFACRRRVMARDGYEMPCLLVELRNHFLGENIFPSPFCSSLISIDINEELDIHGLSVDYLWISMVHSRISMDIQIIFMDMEAHD